MSVKQIEERSKLLVRAITGSDITVIYQDRDLCHQWIENPPNSWTSEQVLGKFDHDLFPQESADILVQAKRSALDSGTPCRMTFEVVQSDGIKTFDLRIAPDKNDEGKVIGLLCMMVDITDQKRREANLQNLLREVSHRSRNLLAIVQSIARQTMRNSRTTEGFLKRFSERVQSIAHSLDVVTRQEWDGATFHDLIRQQLSPFASDTGRLTIEGDDPILHANAALHVGLALQELGSNAASYGVWQHGKGTIVVTVEALASTSIPDRQMGEAANTDGRAYLVTWTEEHFCETSSEAHLRFGSETLKTIVPLAINGKASLKIGDGELVYTLRIPSENFHS